MDKPEDTGIGDIHEGDVDRDGYTTDEGDCDDRDADINPGQLETCDGIDNNCDDLIDNDPIDGTTWYVDADGDGYGDPLSDAIYCAPPGAGFVTDNTDCDDGNSEANPTEIEVCDGVDNDCDDLVDDADPSISSCP